MFGILHPCRNLMIMPLAFTRLDAFLPLRSTIYKYLH